jgi:hypothetical protein
MNKISRDRIYHLIDDKTCYICLDHIDIENCYNYLYSFISY